MKELLEQRKRVKSKKPNFFRTDSHKMKRLSKVWRRPKGLQNKMRLRKRGYPRHVTSGWGSPNAVKGLTPEGLIPINVSRIEDFSNLDSKKHGLILNGKIGARRRLELIAEVDKKGFKVVNMDTKKYVAEVDARLLAKKKAKKVETKKEEKPVKKTPEKIVSKENTKEQNPEEKKKEEKKKQDKLLTKKE